MTDDGIERVLGRLEGKVDALIVSLATSERTSTERHKEHDARFEKHEARTEEQNKKIGDIDGKLNRWGGGLAVIVGIMTFFGDKIRSAIFGS